MAQIGIKLADGSFFPVLTDDHPGRKRLVLTVASSGQPSAQVDLLRRGDEGDQFVGCLVLEGLEESADSEITLVLALNAERSVEASLATGDQYQSLSVSLEQIEMLSDYSLPDEGGGDIEAVADADDGFENIDLPELETTEFDEGLEPPFSAAELESPEGGDALSDFDLGDDRSLDETGDSDAIESPQSESLSDDTLTANVAAADDDLELEAFSDLADVGEPALEAPEEFERDLATSPALPDAGDLDSGIDYAHNEDVGEGQDLDELDEELFGASDESASDEFATDEYESDAVSAASGDGNDFVDAEYDRFVDEGTSQQAPPRRLRPLVLAAVILISVSLVVLAAFGVFRLLRAEPLPDLRAAALVVAPVLRALVHRS